MGIRKDKLTGEQKKEVERLRDFVSRNRLTARMNGTKWRAAIDAVRGIEEYAASFRVKCITDKEDPQHGRWDETFPENIPLYNSIEWLELNSRSLPLATVLQKGKTKDFSEAIKRALSAAETPFTENGEGIRIIGYSRMEKK